MNYFAHAFGFLDQSTSPFFLAGLAVPDWLNVIDRKIKTRSKNARAFLQNSTITVEEQKIAQGIMQHHHDDGWFHGGTAFNVLSLEFAVELREILSPDAGFRPSFLGHILIELLLDDFLIQNFPEKIRNYYDVLEELDSQVTQQTVASIAGRPVERLDWFIGKFLEIRFLYDYSDNEKLLNRLNQIMQRVKLLPLPASMFGFLNSARHRVANQVDQLYFQPRQQANPNGMN